MAQATVRIPVTKWGYVDSETPIGVIDISQDTTANLKYFYGHAPSWHGSILYMGVDDFPSALDKQRIYYFRAKFCFQGDTGQAGQTSTRAMLYYAEDFDPETLEYSNKPALYSTYLLKTDNVGTTGRDTDVEMIPFTSYSSAETLSKESCKSLRRPTVALVNSYAQQYNRSTVYVKLWTLADGVTAPYLEVTYDDSITVPSKIARSTGPDSGYANPRTATEFSWHYEKDPDAGYDCVGEEYGQTSAVFYWKDSEEENYNAITIADGTQSVEVPANTFPINKTIEWYVEGTDDGGTTSETEVYSFSTAAGTAYATAKKPINTVEDGSAPITFEWEFTSDDGQEPAGVDLWWKLPTELVTEFHHILDNESPTTSYTVPGGTFPSGEIQWIVRAYNVDGTAGPWSQPTSGYYSFINVSAPDPPAGMNATNVPLTTITWQSPDQQGQEISIDGVVVKKLFGPSNYRWQVEEPLSDGMHTISVRVFGAYGFWSQPSTVTINVTNTPPIGISLNVTFGIDADMSWNFDSDPGEVITQVFRDGVLIGETDGNSFTDREVLGTHSYYVMVRDNSGNYSQSNTETGEMHVDVKMISRYDGFSGWLELRLSENSMDTDEYQWTQTQAVQHVTGAVYPQLERSPFQDLRASYNCAFLRQEEVHAFETLKGKVVILKSKGDHVVVGMLSSITKRITPFYTTFYFTLQQIHTKGAGV